MWPLRSAPRGAAGTHDAQAAPAGTAAHAPSVKRAVITQPDGSLCLGVPEGGIDDIPSVHHALDAEFAAHAERLGELRDAAAALDAAARARAEDVHRRIGPLQAHEERVKRRTLIILAADALYFVVCALLISVGMLPGVTIAISDSVTIVLLVTVLLATVLGVVAVLRRSPQLLASFIIADAAAVIVVVRSAFFSWQILVLRALVILDAVYLRYVWSRLDREAASWRRLRWAEERQRSLLYARVQAVLHSASEAVVAHMTVPAPAPAPTLAAALVPAAAAMVPSSILAGSGSSALQLEPPLPEYAASAAASVLAATSTASAAAAVAAAAAAVPTVAHATPDSVAVQVDTAASGSAVSAASLVAEGTSLTAASSASHSYAAAATAGSFAVSPTTLQPTAAAPLPMSASSPQLSPQLSPPLSPPLSPVSSSASVLAAPVIVPGRLESGSDTSSDASSEEEEEDRAERRAHTAVAVQPLPHAAEQQQQQQQQQQQLQQEGEQQEEGAIAHGQSRHALPSTAPVPSEYDATAPAIAADLEEVSI